MAKLQIGKRLRFVREKFGYTQQQVANALNIDRSTYSYYETGKTSPDITTLLALSEIFSIGVDEFLIPLDPEETSYLEDSEKPLVKRGRQRKGDETTNGALSEIFSIGVDEFLIPLDPEETSYLEDSEKPLVKRGRQRKGDETTNGSHIYDLIKEEKQLICYYRAMNLEQKKILLENASNLIKGQDKE